MNSDNRSYFDMYLLFTILLIMAVSCISLVKAEALTEGSFFMKQLIWFVLSLGVVSVICLADFHLIRKATPVLYAFGILALVGILVAPESIAPIRNGAKSWFIIMDRISIQPSEFMKVFLVMMLAVTVARHSEKHALGMVHLDLFLICKVALVAGLPIALTLQQNDFGTSLVMGVITSAIVFVSGISWSILLILILILVIAIGSLVAIFLSNPDLLLVVLDEYQLNRIYSWLDPAGNAENIGYQLQQSLLTIGSGRLFGRDDGVPVPEVETDFIFAIIAGQYGYIGASLVIVLYFVIIFRIVRITILNVDHLYESYVCIGVIAWLSFHVFQNVGMVIGLIPITGIPLPLLSYGGSSVLAMMLGLGLVLNVSLKTREFMFDSH